MEKELTDHLFVLADRYSEARRWKLSTIGQACAKDRRFFSRIRGGGGVTLKKYDAVVAWFRSHWPDDAEWPELDRGQLK